MKLLIIGARGMLGSALSYVLADWQPLLWDREEIDITNAAQVQEKITEVKPDIIINAAAYTNVDGAETDSAGAFAVNEAGVRHLAAVAKQHQATLVHYSTDYVFPGTAVEGYPEDAVPGPAVNVYGQSKLAGEQVLAEIAPEYYLVRTAWLYGSGGKNFVDTIIRAAGQKPRLTVVDDQVGSPTYTHDVATATRTLLEENFPTGVYHTVNGGRASWYGFAQEIVRLAGLPAEIVPVPSSQYPLPAKRPAYSMLQNMKGPPLRPWQEALAEYIALSFKQ